MTKHLLLCNTALMISTLAMGCAASHDRTIEIGDVSRAVDTGNANWIDAMRNQNPALLASIFDREGVMLGSDGAVYHGQDAVREVMGDLMKSWGPTETTIVTDNIWLVDEIATETGRYSYTFTRQDGDKTVTRGRYVVRWKLQKDGSWKIESDLGLPNQ